MYYDNKHGHIITYSTPIGAEIYIDDNPVISNTGQIATTPLTVTDIPEGEHTIILKMAGYIDEYRLVNIKSQEYLPIDIALYPDLSYQSYQQEFPTSPDALTGSLHLLPLPIPRIPYGHIIANTFPEEAEIYIDDQPVYDSTGHIAKTPSTITNIPVGIRRITFKKQGYYDESIDVLVENGLYSQASLNLVLKTSIQLNNISFIEYLQPRERGEVHFDTQPNGAMIYIDGQLLVDPDSEESIKTPATVLLFEGRRNFTLELENHYPVHGWVDVFANSRVDIFKNLDPIPGSNIRQQNLQYPNHYGLGDIFVDSSPRGAYIYIDSIPLVNDNNNPILTPARVTGVLEGLHEVQISLDEYYSKRLIVNVIPNKLNIAYGKLQPIY